jgi:hypothetical protein
VQRGRILLRIDAVMRLGFYVDGFNLYYGAVRGTPYKWLNIRELCERLFPKNEIACIRYFTAMVNGTPEDPSKPQRQQTFIRALETLDGFSARPLARGEGSATRRLSR